MVSDARGDDYIVNLPNNNLCTLLRQKDYAARN